MPRNSRPNPIAARVRSLVFAGGRRRGAIVSALVWQVLQWAGAFLLAHMLKCATATYGMFGLVLGLLTWIYLGAVVFVVGVEINVVRERRLWPADALHRQRRADRRGTARLRFHAETERH